MNNFKELEAAFDKAENEFSNALLKQVELLATSVIFSHPNATSFTMGMGSASFGCHWREVDDLDPTDYWDRDEDLAPNELEKETGVPSSFATDLAELLNKYDGNFCLTGYPMFIRQVSDASVTVQTDW